MICRSKSQKNVESFEVNRIQNEFVKGVTKKITGKSSKTILKEYSKNVP